MGKDNLIIELLNIFNEQFSNTQKEDSKDEKSDRIKVSDLKDNVLVIVYNTGTVVVQGKDCDLKNRICDLLENVETKPSEYFNRSTTSIADHVKRATVFKIASKKLISEIKGELEKYSEKQNLKTEESSVIYSYKIKEGSLQLTITQYSNGTLFLQGKADNLWDGICEIIEKKSGLSEKEVAGRFVSRDSKDAEKIVRIITEELVQEARTDAETLLGNEALEFLEEWDKRYLISGLALLKANLVYLPEFSCLIMPIAKAYEGFCKKILIEIGLTTKSENEKRGWSFGTVWNSAKYNKYTSQNKYRKTKLEELKNKLDINRNFNMHSSGATLIQVKTIEEARDIINNTGQSIRDFYNFFVKNKGKG